MNPRATRSALMVASVPELTSRTISIEGNISRTVSASSISCSVGAPKLVPRRHGLVQRVQNRGMAVAENERSPGADVVDVLVAIGIEDVRAFAAFDEGRSPADAAIGADGRVHAAGNREFGAFEELLRACVIHGRMRDSQRIAALLEMSDRPHYNRDSLMKISELRPLPRCCLAAVWPSSAAGPRRLPTLPLP